MKPKLARDILRGDTAYQTGRMIAGILLFLVLAGCAIAIGIMCVTHRDIELEVAIISGAVVQALFSIAIYEVVQSMFDRADAALRQTELES